MPGTKFEKLELLSYRVIFLGQYCSCVPPWSSAAAVDGTPPAWVITFCLPLFLLKFEDNLFFNFFS